MQLPPNGIPCVLTHSHRAPRAPGPNFQLNLGLRRSPVRLCKKQGSKSKPRIRIQATNPKPPIKSSMKRTRLGLWATLETKLSYDRARMSASIWPLISQSPTSDEIEGDHRLGDYKWTKKGKLKAQQADLLWSSGCLLK